MRIFLTAALFAVLAASSASAATVVDPAYGAVLQDAAANKLISQCSRSGPEHVEGQWIPAPEQLRDLEARLPQALDQELPMRPQNSGAARRIARQYAGFIIAGRKIIYVNAFPQSETESPFPGRDPPDWKRNPMLVCDGGAAFFGVEYDPATRSFSHFAFNVAL